MAVSLLVAAAVSCGTTGDTGSVPSQPHSGAGPFGRLTDDELANANLLAPFVIAEDGADLDEPSVVADGTVLHVFLSARRAGVLDIERSDAPALTQPFSALVPVLSADAPWEMGNVSGPSVIAGSAPAPGSTGSKWLLFYAAGGAIGVATSSDGMTFDKAPAPTLLADGGDEGSVLGAPAAVLIGDTVRVYYPAGPVGALYAAEASFSDLSSAAGGAPVTWTRLDGNPTAPGRDPMVAGAPFAASLSRASARAALTPAGRLRHDLYFTAYPNAQSTLTVVSIGYAASFSGDTFSVAPKQILLAPDARSPSVCPYPPLTGSGDSYLLLFSQKNGNINAIGAALSP